MPYSLACNFVLLSKKLVAQLLNVEFYAVMCNFFVIFAVVKLV